MYQNEPECKHDWSYEDLFLTGNMEVDTKFVCTKCKAKRVITFSKVRVAHLMKKFADSL